MSPQSRTREQRDFKDKNLRIFALNDPTAPRINPALAVEIGLSESLILLQIEFWLVTHGIEIDGATWIRRSAPDVQAAFPFLSLSTVKRALDRLENDLSLLFSGNFNPDKRDRTAWYAINPAGFEGLKSIALLDGPPPITAEPELCMAQFDTMQEVNLTPCNGSNWNDPKGRARAASEEIKEEKREECVTPARATPDEFPVAFDAGAEGATNDAPEVAGELTPPNAQDREKSRPPLIDCSSPLHPAFQTPAYFATVRACRIDLDLISDRMRLRCATASRKLAAKYTPDEIEAIGAGCPFERSATPEQLCDFAESWLHPQAEKSAKREVSHARLTRREQLQSDREALLQRNFAARGW